jgi:hypothetical protein
MLQSISWKEWLELMGLATLGFYGWWVFNYWSYMLAVFTRRTRTGAADRSAFQGYPEQGSDEVLAETGLAREAGQTNEPGGTTEKEQTHARCGRIMGTRLPAV